MKSIVEIFKSKQGFDSFEKAHQTDILKAQKILNLKFSEEYIEYLETFGIAEIEGHEFTGILNSKRLNVVDVTKKNKEKYKDLPSNLYVIEELNIDGIIILQDANGFIYEFRPLSKCKKINNSLYDYIKSL